MLWQYLLDIRFDRWNETSNKFTWYKRRRSWKIVDTKKKGRYHWISVRPISALNVSSLNIYTKLWHCIVPEKPAFLKTQTEGSREKTHMYINITVSLLNVSLVCFPTFSISRFCTRTFKRIKKLSYLHFQPSLFEKFKIK